jgi:1-acyl-sn-glycerol-3-phosphate acyltransferase
MSAHPSTATMGVMQMQPVGRSLIQRTLLFPALDAVCHPTVVGGAVLATLDGAYVLVANHSSHLDCPLLLWALPGSVRRRTVVAAARDYFYSNRVGGAALTLALGTIPFDRHGGAVASLRACRQALDAGRVVMMFPEGTRSRDGNIACFKRGAASLAAATGVPIVPVGLRGANAVLPVGSSLPHPRPITVHVGTPIIPVAGESVADVTARVEASVRVLCGAC